MRLLIISHSAHLGGAERSLLTLIDHLRKHMDIRVVLPEKGELVTKLESLGIEFYITKYSWWTIKRNCKPKKNLNDFEKYHKEAKKLHKLLRNWKPDIVYTNTSVICVGGLLAQMMEIPHVWHIREFGEKDHGFIFEYGIKETSKLIDKLSTATIFNSVATRKEFPGITKNTNVIYNAVEIPEMENNPNTNYFKYRDSSKVLIAGTISERKGQYDGVKAIAGLIGKNVNVELILLGHCNYKKLKTRIDKVKYSCKDPSRIQLHDYTSNPYPIFKEADIILVTSRNEAFGRTILEGWLFKKPIVATNSGGVPEIIDNGVTGLLYDVGDINELSKKIELLVGNESLRKTLGQNGYCIAKKKFSIEKYGNNVFVVLSNAYDAGFKPLKHPFISILR